MTQEEMQERNKQIALMLTWDSNESQTEFYPPYQFGGVKDLDDLMFNLNWNWLMEAVEFISKQAHKGFPINCIISNTGCAININPTNVMGDKFEGKTEIVNTLNINYHIVDEKEKDFTRQEAVFIAVSDFAKLYNNKEI